MYWFKIFRNFIDILQYATQVLYIHCNMTLFYQINIYLLTKGGCPAPSLFKFDTPPMAFCLVDTGNPSLEPQHHGQRRLILVPFVDDKICSAKVELLCWQKYLDMGT